MMRNKSAASFAAIRGGNLEFGERNAVPDRAGRYVDVSKPEVAFDRLRARHEQVDIERGELLRSRLPTGARIMNRRQHRGSSLSQALVVVAIEQVSMDDIGSEFGRDQGTFAPSLRS